MGRQIERAKRLLDLKDPEEIKKGANDVKRFMKRITRTKSGEKAEVKYKLDEEKIAEEEKYDFGSSQRQGYIIDQKI